MTCVCVCELRPSLCSSFFFLQQQTAAAAAAAPAPPQPASSSSCGAKPPGSAATPSPPPPEPFEYYDAGNHWCKNCNVTSGSMFDFFTHLHSKTHRKVRSSSSVRQKHQNRPLAPPPATASHVLSLSLLQTLDPYERPWAGAASRPAKAPPSEEKLTKPAKGTGSDPEAALRASARVHGYRTVRGRQ